MVRHGRLRWFRHLEGKSAAEASRCQLAEIRKIGAEADDVPGVNVQTGSRPAWSEVGMGSKQRCVWGFDMGQTYKLRRTGYFQKK